MLSIPELAGHVIDVALEPFLQVGIDRFAGKFLQVLRQLGAKFIGGHLVPRDANHGKLSRQKIVFRQVIKRRDQFAAGKIAGGAENNHCARIATTPDPLGFCWGSWLGHVFIFLDGEVYQEPVKKWSEPVDSVLM